MKKTLKFISVSLFAIAICGCANKDTKATKNPHIVIFNKSLNNKYLITNESFIINKNNDRLEYIKNDTGEIIIIKKISANYDYETCKELAKKDYYDASETVRTRSFNKINSRFKQDATEYTKTEYFKMEYLDCKINNAVNLEQKIYNYEITVGNSDAMPDVVEREPRKSKSYSEEIFGEYGQYVAMPIIFTGVIILAPFYIIQYMSK